MIKRIVKMTFREEEVETFIEFFSKNRPEILKFEGVNKVELFRDTSNPKVVFTISEWDGEEYLQRYRESAFFAETWKNTKVLFEEKASAWSLSQVF